MPRNSPTSWPEHLKSSSLGLPVYVFHDRTSSRVYVGSFNSLQDPAVYKAREAALRLASTVVDKNTKP